MGSYHACRYVLVGEEVEVLKRAKEHAESMLRNINERLEIFNIFLK